MSQVAKLVNDKPKTIHEHYITPSLKDLKIVSEKIPYIHKERILSKEKK